MKSCKECGGIVENDNLSYCPLCDDLLVKIYPNHRQKRKAYLRVPLEEDWSEDVEDN